MKNFLTLFLCIAVVCPAIAQENEAQAPQDTVIQAKDQSTPPVSSKVTKGIAVGVDKDDMDYLISSPSQNWFFGAGVGVQTYIANEIQSSAMWNQVTPAFYLEVGKWILPDLAISLNFSGFNSVSQACCNVPWANTGGPTDYEGYWTQKFCTMQISGLVTLDWTSFIQGYEKGSKRRFHVLTPIGLGLAIATAPVTNPYYKEGSMLGQQATNYELCFSGGFNFDISLTRHLVLSPAIRLLFARQSLDYSAASDRPIKIDFMPNATVGIKYTIFNDRATKKGAQKAQQAARRYTVTSNGVTTTTEMYSSADYAANTDDVVRGAYFVPAVNTNTYTLEKGKTTVLVQETEELEDEIVEAREIIEDQQNQIIRIKNEAAVAVAAAAAADHNDEYVSVFFNLDRSIVDLNGMHILAEFSKVINNSPSDAKYFVIGAADKITGRVSYNRSLSRRRAQAVYDVLVNQYGVDPKKLEMKSLGGIYEYEQADNRVAFVVLSTNSITKLVDKYAVD